MDTQVANANLSAPASYLLNVAEALRDRILPELTGTARDRLNECVTIIARVMSDIQTGSVAEKVDAAEGSWTGIADREGANLDSNELTFQSLQASLMGFTAERDSRSFSAERLQSYLVNHLKGGTNIKVTKSQVLAGGRSKQTVLVEQAGAADLPSALVVRQDWSSAVTGTSVVTEFELLKLIAAAGLRAPMPLILETDAAVLGSPFMVMQRMSGKAEGDIFNPPQSEQLALDLATQLAKLHRLPVAPFDELGVPTEAFSREQLVQGLAGFKELNAQIGIGSPTVGVALDWLEQNISHVSGARALVHNDLGFHNFLVHDGRLTAILDWELAHIGNPAADLGYIRNFIEKMTTWERFMDAYRRAGGPSIEPTTLDFYSIWCATRLFSLLMRARAGVSMGIVHDTEITYACAHFIPQQHQVLSKELRRVLSANKMPAAERKTLAVSRNA